MGDSGDHRPYSPTESMVAQPVGADGHPPPSPSPAAARPPPVGTSPPFSAGFLTHYRFERLLGRGAMGTVHLMTQVKLGRLVAVKVVKGDEVTAEDTRRLLKEARVLAALNHPSILSVYDAGNDGPVPYIVCEYVEGQSLEERLKRQPPLSLRQVLGITMHVLEALRVAHEKGIVHRDLKPANIFLTRAGKPKIGDFGLAKAQSLPSGTSVGKLMGTPAYMSPEQCRMKGTTAASDLYAVGVMLFEMAVGRRPFPGPSLLDHLNQHTIEKPPSTRETRPELPQALDVLVHRAMEKDPGARFKNAAEFLKAVLELYRGLTPARDVTPGPRGSPSAERVALIPGMVRGARYELVRILGQGGMGQVWLAKDQSIEETEVAVKVLPPELWRDADSRVNLVREAKLSLRLAHPCIVRLINLEPGASPFLVMEYVSWIFLQVQAICINATI